MDIKEGAVVLPVPVWHDGGVSAIQYRSCRVWEGTIWTAVRLWLLEHAESAPDAPQTALLVCELHARRSRVVDLYQGIKLT